MSSNPSYNCSRRPQRLMVRYKDEMSLHFDPPKLPYVEPIAKAVNKNSHQTTTELYSGILILNQTIHNTARTYGQLSRPFWDLVVVTGFDQWFSS